MTQNLSPEETAVLRRGMREFARTQTAPGRALPALLERCRRARRRRRAVRAAAAGICVVAVAAGAVTAAQHSATRTAAPAASHTGTAAPSRTGTAAPSPTRSPAMPAPRPEDATSRAGGQVALPAHPAYGTAYPFNWYAHCGITYIGFAGKEWKTDRPVDVPQLDGAYYGPAAVPGYVTLVSASELRFDAPDYITGVTLHITTEEAPLCD